MCSGRGNYCGTSTCRDHAEFYGQSQGLGGGGAVRHAQRLRGVGGVGDDGTATGPAGKGHSRMALRKGWPSIAHREKKQAQPILMGSGHGKGLARRLGGVNFFVLNALGPLSPLKIEAPLSF